MWLTNRSYLNKSATVPLHWGPGANCPCCPSPVGSTGCQIWSQAVGPHFAEWNQIWQQNSVLGPNAAATFGPPGTKIFIHFCHDKTTLVSCPDYFSPEKFGLETRLRPHFQFSSWWNILLSLANNSPVIVLCSTVFEPFLVEDASLQLAIVWWWLTHRHTLSPGVSIFTRRGDWLVWKQWERNSADMHVLELVNLPAEVADKMSVCLKVYAEK